jgi:hypothetical protein
VSATETCIRHNHSACLGEGSAEGDPDFTCDCYCHHVDGEGIPCRECYSAEERAAWRQELAERRKP